MGLAVLDGQSTSPSIIGLGVVGHKVTVSVTISGVTVSYNVVTITLTLVTAAVSVATS